jgi:hypothetical protein
MDKKVPQHKLELTQEIYDLSIRYEIGIITWGDKNAKFEIKENEACNIGILSIWKNDVEPDKIASEWKKLICSLKSFCLGMKLNGNRNIKYKKQKLFYHFDGEPFLIRNKLDITAIIKRSKGENYNYINGTLPASTMNSTGTVSPSPLPSQMPFIPLSLQRHVMTIIQAEELEQQNLNYEDEQLKRWFLLLEELYEDKNDVNYNHIKYVRDFVSHPKCNSSKIIEFLKKQFPESVNQSGTEAIFKRDKQSHINFVSRYQYKARNIAKLLVKQKIEKSG